MKLPTRVLNVDIKVCEKTIIIKYEIICKC